MRDVFPDGRHRSPLSVPAVFQLTVSSLPAGVLIRGFAVWLYDMQVRTCNLFSLILYRDRGYGE